MLSKGGDFDLWESLKVNNDKDQEGKIKIIYIIMHDIYLDKHWEWVSFAVFPNSQRMFLSVRY